jgi:hypothetical protein
MKMCKTRALLVAGAMFLATGAPAFAGDSLGISDAGSLFAEALAALGLVMAIAGVAIAGFLMATNFFLALTVGGSLMVGGTVMAMSETVGGALWGAGLGGGIIGIETSLFIQTVVMLGMLAAMLAQSLLVPNLVAKEG